MRDIDLSHQQANGLILLHDYAISPSATDLSPYGGNGTVVGAVTRNAGIFGNALGFANGNIGVTVPDSPRLRIASGKLSISAWVNLKASGINGGCIIQKRHPTAPGTGYNYGFWIISSKLNFGFNDGSYRSFDSTATISLNQWVHVSMTLDEGKGSSALNFYINGQHAGTPTYTSSLPGTGTQPLQIGNYNAYSSGIYAIDGSIANVRMYNRTLSDAEILDLFTHPRRLFESKKVPLYLFSTATLQTDLSGSAVSLAAATGSISSTIAIVGAAISGSSATGALASSIPLAGSSASISVANGDVSLSVSLSGSATSLAIASGGIGMVIPVDGAAQSVADATGALDGGAGLSGDAASTSTASANLTLAITLSGSALNEALASAGMISVIPLEGTAQSTSTMVGDLTSLAGGALAGSAQSSSSATGQVSISVPVSGAASAYASGAGNISTIMPLSGSSASVVTATGDLVIESAFNLSGNALAQVLASGTINISMPMSGNALARALATAALTDSSLIVRGNIMNIYCSMPSNRVSLALPSRKLILEQ
jgi:hypothetical protein